MHLSTIEITNFRSLKSLSVALRPGLNVLVGRNNTGKTNLLHAIRHALGPAASRGDALWLERDDFYRASAAAEPEPSMSVTLTFAGMTEDQRAHYYEMVDFDLADLDESRAVLRFEASWPKGRRQATIKRTGGPAVAEAPEVPTALLESLPITFLPALRDAEASLAPGYRSRLALLLRETAARAGQKTEAEITAIYTAANAALEAHTLVSGTISSLQRTTQKIAGTDHVGSTINAAAAEFERILRTLQVQMKDAPIGSLSANGLGLNNLLYMAVVLEHLKQEAADECPLLLVEEPEAHLHPQLTMLLAEYLSSTTPGSTAPQTLVTTHSPTLAASVPPNQVHILFTDHRTKVQCCHSVAMAGMDYAEQAALQRMMDITRATLYFAKGLMLVEGISEALLIPVLAKRLGHDLSREHVSVIPVCGVAFATFKKLLDPAVHGIPVAIVSDADPSVIRGGSWEEDVPQAAGAVFMLSDRMSKLIELFDGHQTVKVVHSAVTLEYDLAAAGDDNAAVMAAAWESCFTRKPGTLNTDRVAEAGAERTAKALVVWRGICRADHSGSKAEFAHRLSAKLAERGPDGQFQTAFVVPEYIRLAVEHVITALRPPVVADGAAAG
jgi:putative ATP-dependent endonuclease of OLD family